LPDLADYPLLAKSLHKQLFIRKDNFKSEADWSLIAASDVTLSKYTLIEFFKAVIEHPHASHFYCNTVDSRQGWSFTKPSWDSLYNSSIPLLPPLYFSNANLSEFFPIRLKDALVTEYQRSTPLRDSSDFGLPMFPLIKLGKSGEDVSVIIPTANKRVKTSEGESWLLESIVASIADSKDLGRVEVVVVDNGNLTRDEKRELSKYLKIKYVTDQHRKLNLSRKINMGVSLAKNERLILCNDDIKPENRSTLSLLIPWLDQDNVGVVGPRIHYVGGQLQYAGVSVVDGKCHILGYKQPFDSMGHGWSFLIPRFVSAVTGVLMATTRSCFDSVNGWDKSFPINFNDIDYCLRAKLANYQTVLEPRSRIFHLESASRDLSLPYENDELRFGARWEKHKDVWPELPFITGMPGPESSHDWRKRNLEWKI
jgi:GT2 family glycosyltransferase